MTISNRHLGWRVQLSSHNRMRYSPANSMIAAGIALVASLALAACSSSSAPSPSVPETTSASLPYPEFLTDNQRSMLDYRADLRSVDPCGFFDPGAVSAIGNAKYIGAQGEYGGCSVEYSPAAGPQQITKVEVQFVRTSSGGYGRPVEGTPIRLSATPDLCTSYIPFDESRGVGLSYTVSAKGELRASGGAVREDLCPAAQSMAEAGLLLAATEPQRAAAAPPFTADPGFPAHAQVNHPLATLDPCAVLSTRAVDAPNLYFSPSPLAWECHFDTDTKVTNHVSYTYDYERKALEPGKYNKYEKRVDVGGHPAVEHRSRPYATMEYCSYAIATDPDATAEDADGGSSEGHLINVDVDGGGCDEARATADAIVELYNAHCEALRPGFPDMGRCRG